MELQKGYTLAGGITKFVMYPSKSTLPKVLLGESEESVSIILHHTGSTYTETREGDSVVHTLTIVGYIGEDAALTNRLLKDGVIADVRFNSGAEIRVGVSAKFGVNAPLRLVSCEVVTGEKRIDYPLKKWVWQSIDTDLLM